MTRIVETLRYFKTKTPDLKTPDDYLKENNPYAKTDKNNSNPNRTHANADTIDFETHGWRIMLTLADKQEITNAYNNIPDEVKRRFRTPLSLNSF